MFKQFPQFTWFRESVCVKWFSAGCVSSVREQEVRRDFCQNFSRSAAAKFKYSTEGFFC